MGLSAAQTPPDIVPPRWHRSIPFWTAQLVGWGLFAVVDFFTRQLIYRDVLQAAVLTVIAYAVLLAVSFLLRRVFDRVRVGAIGIVLLGSVLAALATAGVLTTARALFGWQVAQWLPLEQLMLPFVYYSLAFLVWSILYFWVRAEREEQRAREQAAAAQMETLRAEIRELRLQLDPHFLFNALNGLAEEVPEHPDIALAMVRDLTQYLRHLLAGIRDPVVSMTAEADGLAAYLRIQEARFGGRVRTCITVDPDVAERPIANLLLQPLVENAFEHGDRSTRLDVDIHVAADGAALVIEIANTGRLAPKEKAGRHHGIGLANVRRRLDVHYPARHTFALRQAAGREGGADAPRVVAALRLEGDPCSAS